MDTINTHEESTSLKRKRIDAEDEEQELNNKSMKQHDLTENSVLETKVESFVEFIPSNSFEGSKNGFIFKSGHLGLGYYFDIEGTGERSKEETEPGTSRQDENKETEEKSEHVNSNEQSDMLGNIDVESTLSKISKGFTNRKKLEKAVSLYIQFMSAKLQPENASMFVKAIEPLLYKPEEGSYQDFTSAIDGDERAKIYYKLFRTIKDNFEKFSLIDQQILDDYILSFVTRSSLQTDDTYEFANACKYLLEKNQNYFN